MDSKRQEYTVKRYLISWRQGLSLRWKKPQLPLEGCVKKLKLGLGLEGQKNTFLSGKWANTAWARRQLSPVDYLPLVPARRFLLPSLDSDLGAQSMWYPLYLLSLESRVQEVPNLSVVFGWWDYSKRHSVYIIIAMYPWMCFCIIMRPNFCFGA